jgi:nucleotide-binding universal stress UspA family protein
MIELRTLLLATDLGPDSAPAFAHARFLAEQFGARLILYHGVPVPEHRYAHWAFAHGHEVWISAERHARAELERQAQVLTCPHDLVVERRSSALEGILDAIRNRNPDLTVLGTHGREGLAHLMLGSLAEDVMQQSFRPILCVPPGARRAPGPYSGVLVPTDFSEVSRSAFPIAAFMARKFKAEVIALHVVSTARSGTFSALPTDLGQGTEQTLREFFREHFGGLDVLPSVRTGHVWERIAHGAASLTNGLVVMSTRGHDSFSDRILGSNTERVLRHAPCPVLVA